MFHRLTPIVTIGFAAPGLQSTHQKATSSVIRITQDPTRNGGKLDEVLLKNRANTLELRKIARSRVDGQ